MKLKQILWDNNHPHMTWFENQAIFKEHLTPLAALGLTCVMVIISPTFAEKIKKGRRRGIFRGMYYLYLEEKTVILWISSGVCPRETV